MSDILQVITEDINEGKQCIWRGYELKKKNENRGDIFLSTEEKNIEKSGKEIIRKGREGKGVRRLE